jgi:maltooligosyltrehalose trehalohydrolase
MDVAVTLGATCLEAGRSRFLVWAPLAHTVQVHLVAPHERLVPLERGPRGYHQAIIDDVEPGSLYLYRLNERQERPDPASRSQPQDVHGPSQVVASHFAWEDQHWGGLPLQEYLFYELHVGTFTPAGTFDAIVPYLDELQDMGITAIELMPIAQFPGSRNWGYDGVYPFAAQASYGGPEGLKRLVNACHQRGLAVVLDVVYNHLGPEGNYLNDFGPYFTDRYKTPWGAGLNFDGPHSDEVRQFFIENALYWITTCHIDALRLDAVHAIVDCSAYPFLAELADVVHAQAERLQRQVYLIAESDLNDTRLLRAPALGGYGLDVQWNDGFHHALHTLLTEERLGYYQDFGTLAHLRDSLAEGFVYAGHYSAFRQRRHGHSSRAIPAHQFVVCAQNHDQVGNRMLGERLSQLVTFEALKVAASVVILSPCLPLLFMGEEYGETAPFPYFISHLDAALVEAVRRGRREEFSAFHWQGEPLDPQDATTFQRAKLKHHLRQQGQHGVLRAFYKELIRLRRTLPALAQLRKDCMEAVSFEEAKLLCVRRWSPDDTSATVMLCYFGSQPTTVSVPLPPGSWHKCLDSAASEWYGPGGVEPSTLSGEAARMTLPPWVVLLFTQETREPEGAPSHV